MLKPERHRIDEAILPKVFRPEVGGASHPVLGRCLKREGLAEEVLFTDRRAL